MVKLYKDAVVKLIRKLPQYPGLDTNVLYTVTDGDNDGRIKLYGGDTRWYPWYIFVPASARR